MLVSFKIENFKSFKDNTQFSMEASKLKNLEEENTFRVNNINLLKSAVVYGANAGGKSNLLKAVYHMKELVLNSINLSNNVQLQPFLLDKSSAEKEISFEIEFIIEETLYRYGFKILSNRVVLKEWLFQKYLKPRARESKLFVRDEQLIDMSSTFKEGKLLTEKTREDTLFLTVVRQFNGEISEKIVSWFKELKFLLNHGSDDYKIYSYAKLEDEEFKDSIVKLIKNADTGISDIIKENLTYDELKEKSENLDNLPNFIINKIKEDGVSTIKTKHIQYDNGVFNKFIDFSLDMESLGTQKLLALSAIIIETLLNGTVLIVDELDNSLHTELVESIIKLFNSKEYNKKGAQLIFTTHDTNLLTQKLFRRDQIWFVEKDIYGSTQLYSLLDFGRGKARDDLVLEKNYLEGKFGAVPNIVGLEF